MALQDDYTTTRLPDTDKTRFVTGKRIDAADGLTDRARLAMAVFAVGLVLVVVCLALREWLATGVVR